MRKVVVDDRPTGAITNAEAGQASSPNQAPSRLVKRHLVKVGRMPIAEGWIYGSLALDIFFIFTYVLLLRNLHRATPDQPPFVLHSFIGLACVAMFGVSVLVTLVVGSNVPLPYLLSKLITFAVSLSVVLTTTLLLKAASLRSVLGNTWVKYLDFPYLILAAFGLARIVNGSTKVVDHYAILDLVGMLAVAAALGVRLSKATIECMFDPWISGPKKQ